MRKRVFLSLTLLVQVVFWGSFFPSTHASSGVVWGIRPGDVIAWTFSSEVLTPYSHTQDTETVQWKIVEIRNDNLAVRINETHFYKTCAPLCSLAFEVSWKVLDPAYMWDSYPALFVQPKYETNHQSAGIYPLFNNGKTIPEMAVVDKDLSMDWSDFGNYVRGYGIKGQSTGDYTPIETYWLDTRIHKGTGIVTAGDWYYNSNEYSITSTSSLQTSVSFDLASRQPYVRTRAVASADPTSGSAPMLVSFTSSASGGTPPYNYSWDFGDGQGSSEQSPSHTYQNAGIFTAILTVGDSAGGADTASIVISVTSSSIPSQSPSVSAPAFFQQYWYPILVALAVGLVVSVVVRRARASGARKLSPSAPH